MDSEAVPQLDLGEFLRIHAIRAPQLMWFLGAGASAGAGVPTAWDMIWEFKRLIYCTDQRISLARCSNLSDDRLRRRIQHFFDSKSPGTFPPHESDRRAYIDSAVVQGHESFGHLCLAAMLKCDRARIVWTTHFDHLLEDACATVFQTTRSLVHANLDNPQVAISAINQGRWPVLVKIHGDFRSDRLKNIRPELESQDAELRRSLKSMSQTSGLVVAGYSGRDPSVLTALTDALADGAGFPRGLFWLSRRGGEILKPVETLLTTARRKGSKRRSSKSRTLTNSWPISSRPTPRSMTKLDSWYCQSGRTLVLSISLSTAAHFSSSGPTDCPSFRFPRHVG